MKKSIYLFLYSNVFEYHLNNQIKVTTRQPWPFEIDPKMRILCIDTETTNFNFFLKVSQLGSK